MQSDVEIKYIFAFNMWRFKFKAHQNVISASVHTQTGRQCIVHDISTITSINLTKK